MNLFKKYYDENIKAYSKKEAYQITKEFREEIKNTLSYKMFILNENKKSFLDVFFKDLKKDWSNLLKVIAKFFK